jgi:glycosyltransferase involved in cell wall biosynthesis
VKVIISTSAKFHAFHLARELDKRGMLFKIFTGYPFFKLKEEGINKSKITSMFFPYAVFRILRKNSFVMKFLPIRFWYKQVFDYISSIFINNCDVFVGWSSSSLYSIKRAKKRGIVTILERGSAHIEYQNDILCEEYLKYGIQMHPIERKIIEKELKEYIEADYIMVPSSFARSSFIERGVDKDKLIVVPYGVDTNRFKKIEKEDDIFRIIYVGSISIQKGIPYLLKAVSELNRKDIELILVGKVQHEMKKILDEYRGVYKFVGRISQKELYKYYSNGSVFVQPSIHDGFSMVIIEAMSCGLPVIITKNTCGEDIVSNGKEGFVVNIRSSEEIKKKIIYMYNNPEERNIMGDAARNTSSKITWSKYGESIEDVYKKIILGKNNGGK